MHETLRDLIAANFGKAAFYTPEEQERYAGKNLNCCERILRGANIVYGLGMTEEDMRVSAAFGGGMGVGGVCGAITGALMALSRKYAAPVEKATPLKDEITVPFLERVRAKMGSLDCIDLKPRYAVSNPPDCTRAVLAVAETLDETMKTLEAGA